MKLKDAREAYYEYTKKASEVARSLAFGGIALIWVFKTDVGGIPKVPDALLLPAALLATSLAFDLLQGVAGSVIWGVFHRLKERESELGENPEIDAPGWINLPTLFFFWGKLILVGSGFVLIIKFTLGKWLS